ncbi:uncharacterized protein BDV17DRAFT_176751 [Aspergillus undulatus]|uniref:uncharacterized protein n=1 Tax=Aspergillus undulatus TaxID=1810928 RepID=UPI003CCDD2C1
MCESLCLKARCASDATSRAPDVSFGGVVVGVGVGLRRAVDSEPNCIHRVRNRTVLCRDLINMRKAFVAYAASKLPLCIC